MKLFGKKQTTAVESDDNARIKILGSGCPNCLALEQTVKKAMTDLAIDESIAHVKDLAQIATYGVMATPALVIDEKVITYGRVLTVSEVKAVLAEVYDET